MELAFTLLAANDFDVIFLIVSLIFGVIWVLNFMFGPKQAGKAPPPVAKRAAPRRVNPNQPAAAQAERPPDALSAEIEQFLKEAAQRKRDKGRREPVVRSSPARPLATRAPLEAAVDAAVLEPPSGETVSDSVSRHLGNRSIAGRPSRLSDDMKRADLEREQHFQKAFSHKLGRLTDTSHTQPEVAEQPGTDQQGNIAAAVLGNLLSKPENLRQAIVLNEILSRPEHRW
jgi:hypothetical protein